MSFDFSSGNLDPIRVRVVAQGYSNTSRFTRVYTAWVSPSTTAWNSVTLASEAFAYEAIFTIPAVTEFAQIVMASHDASGAPLALSDIGEHILLIDNVVVTATAPEPADFALLFGVIFIIPALRRHGRI